MNPLSIPINDICDICKSWCVGLHEDGAGEKHDAGEEYKHSSWELCYSGAVDCHQHGRTTQLTHSTQTTHCRLQGSWKHNNTVCINVQTFTYITDYVNAFIYSLKRINYYLTDYLTTPYTRETVIELFDYYM